jgi:hypothetical protein
MVQAARRHPRRMPDRLRDHPERRALPHGVAAPDPYLGAAWSPQAREELVPQARFAGPRGAQEQHPARAGSRDAFVEERRELADLALASYERGRPAEEPPRLID